MGGGAIPGPVGIGLDQQMDSGTNSKSTHNPPGPICSEQLLVICVSRKAAAVAVDGLELAGVLAVRVILQELQSIKHDIDQCLRLIATLPEHLGRVVAYKFFAGFFDHYLPKKFLRQYVWARGRTLKLTEQEMIDCNPYIDLSRSKKFNALLEKGRLSPGTRIPLEMGVISGALTNGTLGQFTVKLKGGLVVQADGSWQASGKMAFYDEWDFDPKDWETGGRSFQGEAKTRVAHYTLPGEGFAITSVDTEFQQTNADKLVVWAGGTPVGVPDKAAPAIAKAQRDVKTVKTDGRR